MKKFSLGEAAFAIGAQLFNADSRTIIEAVGTDSRNIAKNSLFVAVKGEIFDGHEFCRSAVEAGAICVLSHEKLDDDIPHILVSDTKYAFLDLAKWYLERFNIPVVAVTGSVGKTTTKDMIYSVLSQKYNVLKNEGNFNNEVGMPLTIFNVDDSHEIAVLEMGMNSFGEIHNLSKVATPEVCVITNIGNAHIGKLGSKEGILQAKSEIFDFADKNAVAILNGDDDLLKRLSHKAGSTLFFGTDEAAFCRARKLDDLGIRGSIWRVYMDGDNFMITIPLPGDYLICNAMAAICTGKHFGIDNESIANAIKSFKPSKNRIDLIEINGKTIVNDVYNASPVSMKAMIDSLSHSEGRKVCILGDMLELGEDSAAYHEEVGAYAGQAKVELLLCTGEFAHIYEKAYKNASGKACVVFDSVESLMEEAAGYIEHGDIVLVKASRGIRLERLVDKLKRCL